MAYPLSNPPVTPEINQTWDTPYVEGWNGSNDNKRHVQLEHDVVDLLGNVVRC